MLFDLQKSRNASAPFGAPRTDAVFHTQSPRQWRSAASPARDSPSKITKKKMTPTISHCVRMGEVYFPVIDLQSNASLTPPSAPQSQSADAAESPRRNHPGCASASERSDRLPPPRRSPILSPAP